MKVFFSLLLEKSFVLLIWCPCKCLVYLLQFIKETTQTRLSHDHPATGFHSKLIFPAIMCVQKQQHSLHEIA